MEAYLALLAAWRSARACTPGGMLDDDEELRFVQALDWHWNAMTEADHHEVEQFFAKGLHHSVPRADVQSDLHWSLGGLRREARGRDS